jgi:hypothetical protein
MVRILVGERFLRVNIVASVGAKGHAVRVLPRFGGDDP